MHYKLKKYRYNVFDSAGCDCITVGVRLYLPALTQRSLLGESLWLRLGLCQRTGGGHVLQPTSYARIPYYKNIDVIKGLLINQGVSFFFCYRKILLVKEALLSYFCFPSSLKITICQDEYCKHACFVLIKRDKEVQRKREREEKKENVEQWQSCTPGVKRSQRVWTER